MVDTVNDPLAKKATRKELVRAIRSAVNMLKICEVEDRALRRAWKASVKQIESTIAAEPKLKRGGEVK